MNRMTLLLARVMVTGTMISAFLIAVGLVWFLSAHVGENPGDHIFSGEPKYFSNPIGMVRRAFDLREVGERRSVAMIGIFLLLLNPPVRVLLAGAGYVLEKNRLYVWISAVVFTVLAISFFW
ncbi:MAG: DUF1634 domain-containing protein [Terrimicrobiaceae bacterium]